MQFGGARSVSGSRGDGGGRSQGALAAVPGVDQVACPAGLDLEQGPGAEEDVGGDLGLLGGQAAGEVPGGDVLVDGVGLDVLVVEVGRLAVAAEPPQGIAVTAGGGGGGGFRGWGGGGRRPPPGARAGASRPACSRRPPPP